MLDNSVQQGNPLNIDPRRIVFKRVLDMNDRALRNIVIGLGGKVDGVPRQDGFDITVASEIMAILCLSKGIEDLKERLANIIVAYTYEDKPVTARDLEAQGAMAMLLKDAIKPNLVQTLEHVPAFIHGGPFANIAHGCNSVMATKYGLKLADYFVTEAASPPTSERRNSSTSSAASPASSRTLSSSSRPYARSRCTARRERRPRQGQHGRARSGNPEPREARREHALLRPPRRRRAQRLPDRHRRRAQVHTG